MGQTLLLLAGAKATTGGGPGRGTYRAGAASIQGPGCCTCLVREAFGVGKQHVLSLHVGPRHVRTSSSGTRTHGCDLSLAHLLPDETTYLADSCAKKPTASQNNDDDVRDIAIGTEQMFSDS